MAGFDFTLSIPQTDRPTCRSLLAHLQRLGVQRELILRFRWCGSGYYVTVDGPLRQMEGWPHSMVAQVVGYAHGLGRRGEHRAGRRIANHLLKKLLTGIRDMERSVHEVARTLSLVGFVPTGYGFDVGGASHLAGPLRGLTRCLELYHDGRLDPAPLVEQLHTGMETLLRDALTDRHSGFPGLVSAARDRRFLSAHEADAFLALSELRRNVKHRGQGVTAKRLHLRLEAALDGCHRLVTTCRSRAENGKPER